MKKIFILTIFGSISIIFAQDIPNTPKEIVQYALTALTNGDFEKLLPITENAELRKTKELLDSIKDNAKKREEMCLQYKALNSWTIEGVTNHKISNRNISIVSTKWIVNIPLEKNPNLAKLPKNIGQNRTVYMDYMLEKFNKQWKIISRKSLN